ncbi:ABC-type antimicrobial peptide transport system, permease component, partial [Snodgrassella alvi SCGC AB-598-O11]
NSWHFYRDQFFESFLMSIQAIMAHKMRSFLTMLGIIIGIASVVSVVALGRGSQEKILENINAMGTNTVSVYPGYGYGDRRSSRIKTLTVGDAEVLKQQDYVDSVTPGVNTSGTLTYDNQSLSAQLYGVGDQYFDVRGIKLAFGRLFNEDDVTQNSQVVVIDDNTKNKLFADGTNPLGKVILFNKRPLRIIGVTEPNNNGFSDSDSLQLFTPYTTLMNRISGSKYITSVTVKVKDNVNSQTAEKGIIELLKVRHGTEDFFTRNSDTIKQTIESTTGTMTLLISSIALISLVVGGIGVMNIMLVSVTERVKEIGIRMAIGARQHNILEQFLIEAVLICLIGGLVGVLFSFAISMLFNLLATDFAMSFSTISIVMAVLCSSVIGVLFGFMPAKRASQLNPIDALSRD